MTDLLDTFANVLGEKKLVDECAKQIAQEVLNEWVDRQLSLCLEDHGAVSRESIEKSEAMEAELQESLSTALGMDYQALANKATAILRSKRSDEVTISDLVRFEAYAMLWPRTIKLRFKH